jgi:hypothetical protein
VAIAAAGGVAPLVRLLRRSSAAAKEDAAGALSLLAIEDANQVAIAEAGAIAPLVELVHRGSEDANEAAAAALGNLARNAANQVAIAAAGAIEPLVELVRDGSSRAKEYAAAALADLALNDANAAAIAAAGGVAPLEQLARDGNENAHVWATSALAILRAVPAVAAAAKAAAAAGAEAARRIKRRKAERDARRLLREQAGVDEDMPEPPEELACSITGEAMIDPVIDALGNTYERSAIQRWLRDHNTSPLTGAVLPHKDLVPNHALWSTIENWEKKAHEECMAKAAAAAARAAAAEAAARRERRKAERVEAGVDQHMPEPPTRFTCPMTGEVMTDPVIDAAGNTYERANIEQWLQENKTAPLTGANKLKSFIEEWEEEQHEDCMAMARPLKKAKVAWPRATLWQ